MRSQESVKRWKQWFDKAIYNCYFVFGFSREYEEAVSELMRLWGETDIPI